MNTSELGAELAQSPLIIENIKVLSELYDMGNKEVKALKARENQSKEIKGLPVSALLVGSPINILYDEGIKRKFKVEFSTKLARRSFFCYLPDQIPEKDFGSVEALIKAEISKEDDSISARMIVAEGIKHITEHNLAKTGDLLEVEEAVRDMFIVYKRYNTEVADRIPKLYPISALVRRHLQWKALKLSGAIAIFNNSDIITIDHYKEAIRFCELLDRDMQLFEVELVKEQYEIFADYMKALSVDGKATIGLHDLRKHGFIPTSGQPDQKMRDLIRLSAAYDKKSVYAINNGTEITYEQIIKTDDLALSILPIDNLRLNELINSGASKDEIRAEKQAIAKNAVTGFQYGSAQFADLATNLLGQDFAYSPFEFKDGKRGKDNLIPKTKLLVFDIDTSDITAEECHFILQDLNHHIALSSDNNNKSKFRLLLELDSVVELTALEWKNFYMSIAQDLAITVDPVPQSQIFYSYAGRDVYSVTDQSPTQVRDHVMLAKSAVTQKQEAKKKVTKAEVDRLKANPIDTFFYAYEADEGEGSRAMLKAALHARDDLQMTKDEIIDLLYDINSYWTIPMDEDRLRSTLISQVQRW